MEKEYKEIYDGVVKEHKDDLRVVTQDGKILKDGLSPSDVKEISTAIFIQKCRDNGNGRPPTMKQVSFFIDLLKKADTDRRNALDDYIKNKGITTLTGDNISKIHNLVEGDGISPVVGVVLRQLVKEKKLRKVDYKLSERKTCHHRPICVFEVLHDNLPC
jgi:hypothetical protein